VTRRLEENLLYAAATAELRGETSKVLRMRSFTGRLPGLYARAGGR
jgi:hypothetical protein